MRMMERLLRNVGRSWDRVPKEVPVLLVKRGAGAHPFMTVEGNQLHLHTLPYQTDLPVKQSIVLEELTLDELAGTLRQMGYEATVTSEAVQAGVEKRKSFTIMDTKDRPISDGHTLETFTSKLWEMLYPLARLLQETDQDIERAIQEMFLLNTKGRWLEYWASFFGLRRALGEADEALRKRIFLTLTNIKTNDVAIEELINYSVQGKVKIEDYLPAKFRIDVTPEYMDEADMIRAIVDGIKGAGIDYLLYYRTTINEHYKGYLQDKTGKPFHENDQLKVTGEQGFEELRFGYTDVDMTRALRVGRDVIGPPKVISPWYQSNLRDDDTIEVGMSEVFPVHRVQRPEGAAFFRTNTGIIGNKMNTLYGRSWSGDIMDAIVVALAEQWEAPSEACDYSAVAGQEEHYNEPMKKGARGFRLGASTVGQGAKLARQEQRAFEGGTMRLEQDGAVLREMAL